MKKLMVVLILFLMPIKVNALSAESAIVMDADSGRILYSKNIGKEKLIASTTKIMTAIIALEYGDLEEKVTVDEDVLKAYGSAIYIEIGEELTLKDLLYGLMLRSGNDAAIEIANNISGSMENFVMLMNKKAEYLGMKNTIFYNNHGLEENNGKGNTSTSYDMALLMKYAIKNDLFKEIISTKEYQVTTNYKTYIWKNKNKLLNMYKYTIGGKTGYTEKAKRTLVTSASKDNKNLIVVTLNDGNDFNDHMNLYEEYFKKYELVEIIDKDKYKIKDDYYKGKLFINQSYKVLLTKEEKERIKTNIILYKIDNINDGEYVGYIEIKLDDTILGKINIFYRENKEIKKQSIIDKIKDFLIIWK